MKVCVIDEWLDGNLLSEIVNETVSIEYIGGEETDTAFPKISHGTICMSLLVEALQDHKLLDCVHLIHLSVSTDRELRSYSKMLQAIKYCMEHHVDIVSISIGVFQRSLGIELANNINNQSLYVAATANDFTITYPASMPEVLGVRYARDKIKSVYKISSAPSDGVDIDARLPETSVMKLIEEKYGIRTQESNSAVAPRVCAELVAAELKIGKPLTKEIALEWLAKRGTIDKGGFQVPYAMRKAEDDKCPTVFLPVDNTDNEQINKIIALQKHFEARGYTCGVISDFFAVSDFLQGRYRLNSSHIAESIDYYQSTTSENLFLLFAKEKLFSEEMVDWCIPKWWNKHQSELCDMILQKFPEEAY